MKIRDFIENRYIKIAIILFFILGIFFIILKVSIIKEILSLLMISFVIAYTLKPIQDVLIEKGIRSNYSALILVIGLFLGIILIATSLIPYLIKESSNIGSAIEEAGNYFQGLYYKLKPEGNNKIIHTLFNTVNIRVNKGIVIILNKVIELGAKFSEDILAYLIIPIITYYFLCDNEYLKNKMILLCPIKSRVVIKKINKDVDRILGRYIITQFILCGLIFTLTFIILFFLHVKLPFILAILNGVFNIIPYFGPIFGAVPCIIVAFLTSTKTALYTTLWLYMLQLVEGNIISPKLTGKSVSIHPVGIIIILLIGEKFGGFLGMILAVPISVIIKVIYEDLNYYLF